MGWGRWGIDPTNDAEDPTEAKKGHETRKVYKVINHLLQNLYSCTCSQEQYDAKEGAAFGSSKISGVAC